jgi:hypothetical protein
MTGIRVEIRRYVDDGFPGVVECWLTDADDREWCIIEKVPVVTLEELDARSPYPRPGIIACRVIERRVGADGREVVVVDTEEPWHVEATTGETRFVIRPEQLEEFAWGH